MKYHSEVTPTETSVVTNDKGQWSLVTNPKYTTAYLVLAENNDGTYIKGGQSTGEDVLVQVRGIVTLATKRIGERRYRFTGRVSPKEANREIAMYRISNNNYILQFKVKTFKDGTWDVVGTFRRNYRGYFFTQDSDDGVSTGARSAVLTLDIH